MSDFPGPNQDKESLCKIQGHPLGLLKERTRKLLELDKKVAKKTIQPELREQLITEIEGLTILNIHDMTRLLWEIRYQRTYETWED
jgi:hypothetical protein